MTSRICQSRGVGLLTHLRVSGRASLLAKGVKATVHKQSHARVSNLRNDLIVTKLLFNYLCTQDGCQMCLCDHQSMPSLGDGNSGPRNREGVNVEGETSNTQEATGC